MPRSRRTRASSLIPAAMRLPAHQGMTARRRYAPAGSAGIELACNGVPPRSNGLGVSMSRVDSCHRLQGTCVLIRVTQDSWSWVDAGQCFGGVGPHVCATDPGEGIPVAVTGEMRALDR